MNGHRQMQLQLLIVCFSRILDPHLTRLGSVWIDLIDFVQSIPDLNINQRAMRKPGLVQWDARNCESGITTNPVADLCLRSSKVRL